MAKKKNADKNEIENLCSDEDTEISFVDNPVIKGKEVASFDFDDTGDTKEDNNVLNSNQSTTTPLINNSKKTHKRTYVLTESTIRKVDELKVKHPDLSTYVSTIVEDAINFYYDYVMNLDK